MELDRAKHLAGIITEQKKFNDAGEMLRNLLNDVRKLRQETAWQVEEIESGNSPEGLELDALSGAVSSLDEILQKYADAKVTPRR